MRRKLQFSQLSCKKDMKGDVNRSDVFMGRERSGKVYTGRREKGKVDQ